MKLFIVMCASLTLAACSSTPLRPEAPIQANLLQKCPEVLPPLPGNTGADVLPTMKEWAVQYHDCRLRHNGLVDALSAPQSKSMPRP